MTASMSGLSGPLQQDLLLVVAEPRRMIECGVVPRRHRASADRLLDAFQLGGPLFGVVGLPVGKVEHAASRIGGQVSRGNRRIPWRAASARMALEAGALKNRVDLRIGADAGGGGWLR